MQFICLPPYDDLWKLLRQNLMVALGWETTCQCWALAGTARRKFAMGGKKDSLLRSKIYWCSLSKFQLFVFAAYKMGVNGCDLFKFAMIIHQVLSSAERNSPGCLLRRMLLPLRTVLHQLWQSMCLPAFQVSFMVSLGSMPWYMVDCEGAHI